MINNNNKVKFNNNHYSSKNSINSCNSSKQKYKSKIYEKKIYYVYIFLSFKNIIIYIHFNTLYINSYYIISNNLT